MVAFTILHLAIQSIPVNVNLAYAEKDVTILAADCGNNSVKLKAYGNNYPIGNPYPCALGAYEFIKDNVKETINTTVDRDTENRFSGVLYF